MILVDLEKRYLYLPHDTPAFHAVDFWDLDLLGPITLEGIQGMPRRLDSFELGQFVILNIDRGWEVGQVLDHPDKVLNLKHGVGLGIFNLE